MWTKWKSQQRDRFAQEINNLKINQEEILELKIQLKCKIQRFFWISGFEKAKQVLHKLEDGTVEIIQSKEQKEKKITRKWTETKGPAVLIARSNLTLCDPVDYTACQASRSTGFPRHEYWGGLWFPSPKGPAEHHKVD